MRKLQVKSITYFITAESWRLLKLRGVDPLVVETHLIGDTFKDFFKGSTYRDLATDRSAEIAVLCAHGYYNPDGVWVYNDGTKIHKVDDWVRRHDGEYTALLLFVCNAESTRLRAARHSVLVVPEGDIAFDIAQVEIPGGEILQLPRDNDKVPTEFLQSYTGPFYEKENYPKFIVLAPKNEHDEDNL